MLRNTLTFLLFIASLGGRSALANTIQATFTGVNGENAFGYYIGPYYGQLNDEKVVLFCNDFANEVVVGQKWLVNLSPITAGSDLQQTRYGDTVNALGLYQQIAWLDLQFGQQPTTQWGDLHATIWQIFDPKEAPKPSSSYWLEQAQKNYSSVSYDNFRIVTNVGPVEKMGQVQEFLTLLPGNSAFLPPPPGVVSTPEPETAVLMGTALLAAAVWFQLKQKRARSRG